MALSILDGNQSATTLSTIVTSGQHITAHTVVSLGTQAITDIASAVSGTSVCVGSISISGTPSVTGSVSVLNFPASQTTTFGAVTGSVSVLNFPASQAVTFGATTGSVSILNFPASQAVTFSAVTISNFPSTQTIAGTVTANLGTNSQQELENIVQESQNISGKLNSVTIGSLPLISGTVTVGNSVTISSLPALVAGTAQIGVVTIGNIRRAGDAVLSQLTTEAGSGYLLTKSTLNAGSEQIGSVTASISGTVPVSISSVTVGNSVTIGNFPASQAVTFGQAIVSASNITALNNSVGTDGGTPATTNFIKIGGHQDGANSVEHIVHVSAGGSMKVDASDSTVTFGVIRGTVTIGNSITIGSLPAISGTVTANGGDFSSIVGESMPSKAVAIGFYSGDDAGIAQVNDSNRKLPISGTVTANLSISSTVITSGSFTSLTSATLVPSNTARKMATVYNLGAGQLFVQAGATATTLGGGFMVALSSGDFYECDYTTTTLSAIFATAGTASWVSH